MSKATKGVRPTGIRARPPRSAFNAAHLRRQTLGDAALAAELLDLFALQSRHVLRVLDASPTPAEAATMAHALVGAARAVGATDVARAAEAAETAACTGSAALAQASGVLVGAVATALAAMSRRTGG